MNSLVLCGLLATLGQFPAFYISSIITEKIATPEQQELQQLRLEQQIQKQVREEFDRTLNRTLILIFIALIFATGLSLISGGIYWFIQRKLNLELTKSIQDLSQLLQQLIKLESGDRPSPQFPYKLLGQQSLEQTVNHEQNSEIPALETKEKLEITPEVITAKKQILEELANYLPPLSQEKVFPEQEIKLTEAVQQLTELIEDCPDLSLTAAEHTYHAHALYFLGQDSEAIALYNRSLDLDPAQSNAWHQKGTIHLKQEDYEEAIAAYNQALNLQADYAPSWYKLAYCYALTGELDSALSHLQRAVNLNPIFRTRARMSPDFDILRENERFQALISS